MSDSFSDLLGLRYQQTGGNDNTWGELLNTDVFEVLENAITGIRTHSVTGGAFDLSASPMVEELHIFSGVLTSDLTVTVPTLTKAMTVINNTTGNFAMFMKTSAGTAISIPRATRKKIYVVGTGMARLDVYDVGKIEAFGGTTAPAGTLECDGSAILRASYPELFTAIGTTWGVGNGTTTFNIPDFKTAGRFLRSRTASVAVGTSQVADIAAHGHSGSTATFTGTGTTITATGSISVSTPTGSVTTSITGSANGSVLTNTNTGAVAGALGVGTGVYVGSVTASSSFTGNAASGNFTGNAVSHTPAGTISVTIANSSGSETRPINASVMYVIKV